MNALNIKIIIEGVCKMECKPSSPISGSPGAPLPSGAEESESIINDTLPPEMIRGILERVPLSDRTNASRTCRLWSAMVRTLPDPVDPNLKVFGPEAWEEYYNYKIEGEIPPIPERIHRISRSLRRRLRGEKEAPTLSLLFIPKGLTLRIHRIFRSLRRRLGGEKEAPTLSLLFIPKGLTLNKLKNLVRRPINGNSRKFDCDSWQRIFDELGDEPIQESYWVLMTNDVIEGTRCMSYSDQVNLVATKTESECQAPTLLEAAVCCFMNHVSSGEDKTYLFERDPWTYTRCQEKIEGWPLVVGGFASGGLCVSSYHFAHDIVGIAARRKFC